MRNTAQLDLLDARVRLPQHVVHRAFVSETVVLDLKTGTYHGLNPTAGRMLESLEQSASVRETVRKIATEYRRTIDEIEPDVLNFCAQLLERGLLEIVPNGRR